jgi:hypothetical protein
MAKYLVKYRYFEKDNFDWCSDNTLNLGKKYEIITINVNCETDENGFISDDNIFNYFRNDFENKIVLLVRKLPYYWIEEQKKINRNILTLRRQISEILIEKDKECKKENEYLSNFKNTHNISKNIISLSTIKKKVNIETYDNFANGLREIQNKHKIYNRSIEEYKKEFCELEKTMAYIYDQFIEDTEEKCLIF